MAIDDSDRDDPGVIAALVATDDLGMLAAAWLREFGEPLPYGFDVTSDDFALIRRCLRSGDKRPFERLLEERAASGVSFGE